MILCIDAQIFVWGIKNQSSEGQEDMVSKAITFFKWVDENKHDILFPTPVIAEILIPEPVEKHANYLEIINKNFMVGIFDVAAATKYAQILNGRFDELKTLANDNGIRREKMKIDHMIIATAICNHANCIYSYDKGLKKFAAGLIDVREFPSLFVQKNLFS